MPSISVSQHVWEYLQRESQRRGGQPVSAVLGDLLGVSPSIAVRTTPQRTPLKTFREAIIVALGQLGGRATNGEVLAQLSATLTLSPDDNHTNQKGTPRWK